MSIMFRSLTVHSALFAIVYLTCQTHGEIHRVKSAPYASPGHHHNSAGVQIPLHRTVHKTDVADNDISHSSVDNQKGPSEVRSSQCNTQQVKKDSPVMSEQEEFFLGFSVTLKLKIWIFSILSAIIVGLSGILPLVIIPLHQGLDLRHGPAASQLKLLLSFAVGSLLGDVFLHLLPEAWLHVKSENERRMIGLWVMAGILTFLIIEKLCSDEQTPDEEKNDEEITPIHNEVDQRKSQINGVVHRNQSGKTHKNGEAVKIKNGLKKSGEKYDNSKNKTSPIHIRGYLNLAANVIDNFTHGLALAGSYLISIKVGLLTTFAILVHEIPHEIGDFAILLRSGFDRWKAAKAQLATASGGILGALTALTASSAEEAGNSTAWILPFTSGGFLYIALVTVTPDLLQEKNHRESLKQVIGVCAGIGVMGLVTLLFE